MWGRKPWGSLTFLYLFIYFAIAFSAPSGRKLMMEGSWEMPEAPVRPVAEHWQNKQFARARQFQGTYSSFPLVPLFPRCCQRLLDPLLWPQWKFSWRSRKRKVTFSSERSESDHRVAILNASLKGLWCPRAWTIRHANWSAFTEVRKHDTEVRKPERWKG